MSLYLLGLEIYEIYVFKQLCVIKIWAVQQRTLNRKKEWKKKKKTHIQFWKQ